MGKFQITFTIGLSLILFLIGALAVALYYTLETHHTHFVFAISVVGGLATIYSAFYVAEGLKKNYMYAKHSKTFEFIQKFDGVDLSKMLVDLDLDFKSDDIPPKQLYDEIMTNKSIYLSVRRLLNLCEDISLAIQYDLIDEELAFSALRSIICGYVRKFTSYIEETNKTFGRDTIYCESIKLSNAWKAGKYLYSGKPIPSKK